MISGLSDFCKIVMASETVLGSAKLTGGEGQQDVALQEKQSSLTICQPDVTDDKLCRKHVRDRTARMTANLTLLRSTLALTMSPAMST